MKKIFALLFLAHFSVFGQKIYQPHEVEKQAEPAGGVTYLNQFLAANLQIPFQSAIKGLNGRVFLRGVVEADGSMANIEVVKGIDKRCDAEAVRALGLYNAWKPAVLKGEKVKQSVSFPVTFKSPEKTNFDSTKWALVDYFDDKYVPTSDPKKVEYRMTMPVDSNGFVRGNVSYDQGKGSNWKNVGTAVFEKKEIWYKLDYDKSVGDSVKAYLIFARDRNMASHSSESVFQMDGKLLAHTEYGLLNQKIRHKSYDIRGLARKFQIFSDSAITEISWYDNGQIMNVVESDVVRPPKLSTKVYVNAWSRDGMQTVKDGDGYWKQVQQQYDGKWLVEEGRVVSGAKNGKWIGKWADSTLHYEEQYELGVLDKGKSFENGIAREYTEPQISPAFKGGMNEFYKFLGQNIRYPSEAARRGVQGRVALSFVVCEDGSLCDYKVENRVGFGLDDEALRVIKKMSGMWEPGVLRGKKVPVKYNVPVNFQLGN